MSSNEDVITRLTAELHKQNEGKSTDELVRSTAINVGVMRVQVCKLVRDVDGNGTPGLKSRVTTLEVLQTARSDSWGWLLNLGMFVIALAGVLYAILHGGGAA